MGHGCTKMESGNPHSAALSRLTRLHPGPFCGAKSGQDPVTKGISHQVLTSPRDLTFIAE